MLIHFFEKIRAYGVPVTIRELLDLISALEVGVVHADLDDFYALSRATLVKNEAHFDRFDRAFKDFWDGVASLDEIFGEIPEEWLRKIAEKTLTDEEKAQIEALGGFDKVMEALRERLENQEKRHQGGNKNIGTAGTSPFGAYGYNPEGVRIGQAENRNNSAIKVWDRREFKDLDSDREVGTRNIKVALRRLRRFAREGAADELDIDDTITSTAQNAGFLDIKLRPERRNAVKLLMFFDVGGSMDPYISQVEELFSAASSEFKNLEYFYFHNCLYESVWKDNRRRNQERMSTYQVLNTYPADYRVIFVGDATMSPYEIAYAGGSVEHWNAEPGALWMQRVLRTYQSAVWINPQAEETWRWHQSIEMVHELMEGRMFPLTLGGLTDAMRSLS